MKLLDAPPNTYVQLVNGRQVLFNRMERNMALVTDANNVQTKLAGWTEVTLMETGPVPEPPPTDYLVE